MKSQTFSHLLKQFLLLPLIIIFGAVTIIGSGGNGDDDGGGGTLVFSASDDIDWVAMQDGSGAWSKVEPDVSGGNVYTHTIQDANGRYGIAAHELDASDSTHSMIVLQGTLLELANVTLRPSPLLHNVTVNATNMTTAGTLFSISRDEGYIGITTGSVGLAAEDGIRDLVAIETPGAPTRGVIRRNIDINGPTTLDVDFGNEVNVPSFTLHDIILLNQNGITPTHSGYVKFVTANRTINYGITEGSISSPDGYYALHDNGVVNSDYYSIEMQDEFDNGGFESAIEIKRNIPAIPDPGNLTFDFDITPFSGANADVSTITGLAYTPDAGMPDLIAYSTSYAQARASDQLEINYIITPRWLGGGSSYIRPDFSGVTGFNPLWDLTSGAGYLVQVSFTVSMYNVPIGVPLRMHTDWIPNLYMVQPKMRTSFIP